MDSKFVLPNNMNFKWDISSWPVVTGNICGCLKVDLKVLNIDVLVVFFCIIPPISIKQAVHFRLKFSSSQFSLFQHFFYGVLSLSN